jgi:hypothetical protein
MSLFVRLRGFDTLYLLGYDAQSNSMYRFGGRHHRHHLEELDMLLASSVALLALFAFVSILLSSDEGREGTDPRNHLAAWTRYGMR